MTKEEKIRRNNIASARWRKNNPEAARKATAKWRRKNREYHRKISLEWARKNRNPEKNKAAILKYEYGLTLDDFKKLKNKQNNQCAICKKIFTRTPQIDHNHKNNKIRGLLCRFCNLTLGNAHDDIFVLKNAIKYLKSWDKKHGTDRTNFGDAKVPKRFMPKNINTEGN